MKSFHLTIDSLALSAQNPSDITVYLEKKIPSYLTRVSGKNVIISYSGQRDSICYIHCDILNRDDNVLNDEKSDVLAIIPVNATKKYIFHKPASIYKDLKSTDFTSIRIVLTDRDNVPLKHLAHIIYELEFIM